MKRLLFIMAFGVYFCAVVRQESGKGKKLGVKSVLNQQEPKPEMEKWISKPAETTSGKSGLCQALIPSPNNFHQKYADQLNIIGISDKSADKVKPFNLSKIEYFKTIEAKFGTTNILEAKNLSRIILTNHKRIMRRGALYQIILGFDKKVFLT